MDSGLAGKLGPDILDLLDEFVGTSDDSGIFWPHSTVGITNQRVTSDSTSHTSLSMPRDSSSILALPAPEHSLPMQLENMNIEHKCHLDDATNSLSSRPHIGSKSGASNAGNMEYLNNNLTSVPSSSSVANSRSCTTLPNSNTDNFGSVSGQSISNPIAEPDLFAELRPRIGSDLTGSWMLCLVSEVGVLLKWVPINSSSTTSWARPSIQREACIFF
ncbi:unnamed protein product [Protopolystoma xenopodis]|uniref:Uncharacterized protein n=1 Tax=Protopolystoma xenopodis TaxID=117903 RepID=A0A3S5FD69_9PLAT|nr:unnamed protein product [Protopolystoma xenopodis]